MWSQRSTVDYALARRAALMSLAAGRASTAEVCDANVYLRRAARYHGEPSGQNCPVCRRSPLVNVTYTFGDCFRAEVNGRARATRDLPALARQHGEFRVYVVEVCDDCGWNHLVTSFLLGTGRVERRPRRRAHSSGAPGVAPRTSSSGAPGVAPRTSSSGAPGVAPRTSSASHT